MTNPIAQENFAMRFGNGLAAPWAGFRFLNSRPGLWRYGIIPVVLNLLITAVVLAGLLAVAGWFVYTLHPRFDGGWGWRAIEALTAVGIFLAAAAGAMIAWVILQGILCGYFYEKLAAEVERTLGVRDGELCDVPFLHQVVDTVADVSYLAAVATGCLAIQIVPGIGSVVGLVVGYYTGAMTLGMDYFEYPLALRGNRRSDKRAFARQYRAEVLGLGTTVTAVMLIPLVSAILLTTAAAGAVLLHRQLMAEGEGGPESPRPHAPAGARVGET